MTDNDIWMEARKRLAAQLKQPFHRNAILNGDWDRGALVANKVAEVMAEQGNLVHKDTPSERCALRSD